MNLTKFLLARIAEDEVEARKRMHHAQQNDLMVRDPKYLGMFMPGWNEWREIEALAGRILAEVEAKRSLIERVGHPDWAGFRILAAVYAGHPDYDPAWRS